MARCRIGPDGERHTVTDDTTDHTGTDTDPDVDLAPQVPRAARPRRRWIPIMVAVAVVVGVAALVWNLVDGSLFFYNADEAVERRDDLGDDRFRLQGTPLPGTKVETTREGVDVVAFTVAYEGVAVDVVHFGDHPALFQDGVPVVLEGGWVEGSVDVDGFAGTAGDGWHFSSDRMLVKHDNDYLPADEYEERIAEAERGGAVPVDTEP